VNGVHALRLQISSILNALEEVSKTANDLMAQNGLFHYQVNSVIMNLY